MVPGHSTLHGPKLSTSQLRASLPAHLLGQLMKLLHAGGCNTFWLRYFTVQTCPEAPRAGRAARAWHVCADCQGQVCLCAWAASQPETLPAQQCKTGYAGPWFTGWLDTSMGCASRHAGMCAWAVRPPRAVILGLKLGKGFEEHCITALTVQRRCWPLLHIVMHTALGMPAGRLSCP